MVAHLGTQHTKVINRLENYLGCMSQKKKTVSVWTASESPMLDHNTLASADRIQVAKIEEASCSHERKSSIFAARMAKDSFTRRMMLCAVDSLRKPENFPFKTQTSSIEFEEQN